MAPLGGNASYSVRSDPVITGGRGFANIEASPVFTANLTSQTLPPIGTPPVKVDSDTRSNSFKYAVPHGWLILVNIYILHMYLSLYLTYSVHQV